MKRGLFLASLVLICGSSRAQEWKPAGERIMTRWAAEVSPDNVLPEYPRPQLTRERWQNLNGMWSFVIRPVDAELPEAFPGSILVPFPVESALSGVGRSVGEKKMLWYRRLFDVPDSWSGNRILLNFGAVDWETTVYINGKEAGSHRGGYTAFSIDITNYVGADGPNELVVSVWDPSDRGVQPRGKQVRDPSGIWYTAVTGIWQTVWLEPVNYTYIRSLKSTPDIDERSVDVRIDAPDLLPSDELVVTVSSNGLEVARGAGAGQDYFRLPIDRPHLWSPSDPFLYDMKVTLKRGGSVLDEVTSYVGMRKISVETDASGISRLNLNNEFLFQMGTLDQGWWPDGLYTAPTDEALAFDIVETKRHGFNMIRKHVKVEPARWYYHADRIGMLVWQDMPSGDFFSEKTDGEAERPAQSARIFTTELRAMIDQLYNSPSIVEWVPFNEEWGQFDTIEILNWIGHYDPSRLVDGPSGWTDFPAAGDVFDIHRYPGPAMPENKKDGRALALGEFGGLGLPVEGHTWQEKENWGYRSYQNREALQEAFVALIRQLPDFIDQGLSAAIYTQTTDVEIEVNGLMTYDREVTKMNPDVVKKELSKLIEHRP
jgi:beta-galactosidase/beta-glucuronidase